jgi:hypothetical protein
MKLTKSLIAKSVAAVALIAGAAVPAFAQTASNATAPVFTINTAGIGAGYGSFQADQIAGTSTELLHTNTDGSGHTGSGWLSLGNFALGGLAIGDTGLNSKIGGAGYQLYVTFQLSDTYRAGTGSGINTANSINDLTSLSFQFYADRNFDNTYNSASSAGTGTEATVGGNTGNDILLATGSLISGVANFNEHFGAGLNSTQTFTLTNAGAAFFVNPVPFYDLAFDEFNNTTIGASVNGNLVAINQASGSVDFIGSTTSVPEPASLSLLGLGMLGLAVAKRRRAK